MEAVNQREFTVLKCKLCVLRALPIVQHGTVRRNGHNYNIPGSCWASHGACSDTNPGVDPDKGYHPISQQWCQHHIIVVFELAPISCHTQSVEGMS